MQQESVNHSSAKEQHDSIDHSTLSQQLESVDHSASSQQQDLVIHATSPNKQKSVDHLTSSQQEGSVYHSTSSQEQESLPTSPQQQESVDHSTSTQQQESVDHSTSPQQVESVGHHTSCQQQELVDHSTPTQQQESVDNYTPSQQHELVDNSTSSQQQKSVDHPTSSQQQESVDHPTSSQQQGSVDHSTTSQQQVSVDHYTSSHQHDRVDHSTSSQQHKSVDHPTSSQQQELVDHSTSPQQQESVDHSTSPQQQESADHSTSPLEQESVDHYTSSQQHERVDHSTSSQQQKSVDQPTSPQQQESVGHYTSSQQQGTVHNSTSSQQQESVDHSTSSQQQESVYHPTSSQQHESVDHSASPLEQKSVDHSTSTQQQESVNHSTSPQQQESLHHSTSSQQQESVDHSTSPQQQESVDHSTSSQQQKSVVHYTSSQQQEAVGHSTSTDQQESVDQPTSNQQQESFDHCTSSQQHASVDHSISPQQQEFINHSTSQQQQESIDQIFLPQQHKSTDHSVSPQLQEQVNHTTSCQQQKSPHHSTSPQQQVSVDDSTLSQQPESVDHFTSPPQQEPINKSASPQQPDSADHVSSSHQQESIAHSTSPMLQQTVIHSTSPQQIDYLQVAASGDENEDKSYQHKRLKSNSTQLENCVSHSVKGSVPQKQQATIAYLSAPPNVHCREMHMLSQATAMQNIAPINSGNLAQATEINHAEFADHQVEVSAKLTTANGFQSLVDSVSCTALSNYNQPTGAQLYAEESQKVTDVLSVMSSTNDGYTLYLDKNGQLHPETHQVADENITHQLIDKIHNQNITTPNFHARRTHDSVSHAKDLNRDGGHDAHNAVTSFLRSVEHHGSYTQQYPSGRIHGNHSKIFDQNNTSLDQHLATSETGATNERLMYIHPNTEDSSSEFHLTSKDTEASVMAPIRSNDLPQAVGISHTRTTENEMAEEGAKQVSTDKPLPLDNSVIQIYHVLTTPQSLPQQDYRQASESSQSLGMEICNGSNGGQEIDIHGNTYSSYGGILNVPKCDGSSEPFVLTISQTSTEQSQMCQSRPQPRGVTFSDALLTNKSQVYPTAGFRLTDGNKVPESTSHSVESSNHFAENDMGTTSENSLATSPSIRENGQLEYGSVISSGVYSQHLKQPETLDHQAKKERLSTSISLMSACSNGLSNKPANEEDIQLVCPTRRHSLESQIGICDKSLNEWLSRHLEEIGFSAANSVEMQVFSTGNPSGTIDNESFPLQNGDSPCKEISELNEHTGDSRTKKSVATVHETGSLLPISQIERPVRTQSIVPGTQIQDQYMESSIQSPTEHTFQEARHPNKENQAWIAIDSPYQEVMFRYNKQIFRCLVDDKPKNLVNVFKDEDIRRSVSEHTTAEKNVVQDSIYQMQESSPSPALSVAEDFASKIYPRAQLTERGLPEWAKKALPSDEDAPATTEANNSDNTASNSPRLDKKSSNVTGSTAGHSNCYIEPKQPTKKGKKNCYDKKDYCLFCGESNANISRHIEDVHRANLRVSEILMLPRNEQRRVTMRIMINEGNFKHNVEVMKQGKGHFVIARRVSHGEKEHSPWEYLPCEFCKLFVLQKLLWHHIQKCQIREYQQIAITNENSSDGDEVDGTNICGKSYARKGRQLLYSALTESVEDECLNKLFMRMHDDDIKDIAMKDVLIRRVGYLRMEGLGDESVQKQTDPYRISQSMRSLARLVKRARQDKPAVSLWALLSKDCIDIVIKSAKAVSFEEEQAFTLAGKLGNLLSYAVMNKIGLALRRDDHSSLQDANAFKALFDLEFSARVTKVANKKKAARDMKSREELPLAKDLVTLRDHIVSNCKKLTTELLTTPSPGAWQYLCRFLHARIILFNKRRGNEVSELKLETYQERPNWTESSMEFDEGLSFVEKEFSKR